MDYMFAVIVVMGIVLRCMVSLHPYSGQGKLPMFGDYEAQRHWMEITYNLPVSHWYVNGSDNDLQYWGLDYPPLTAYHSWLLGAIAHYLNSSWVELNVSHGHESYSHKAFMRNSVLAADLLTYIPAAVCYCLYCLTSHVTRSAQMVTLLLALINPSILLVDYGHFQYNCVSLGLTLWAIVGLHVEHKLLGSVAFVLAINYKQMSVYHALPFFTYLLGTCLHSKRCLAGIWRLSCLVLVVIATFAVCWFPFLTSKELLIQVIHRLFPFARGLFELIVLHATGLAHGIIMSSICPLACTVFAVLPSSLHLLRRPSLACFRYALVNSSLAFYLFSFQVHEKSILLVTLPVSLLLLQHPLLSLWFFIISAFSMLPLLIKDQLVTAYLALIIIYYLVADLCLSQADSMSSVNVDNGGSATQLHANRTLSFVFWMSMVGMVVLTCMAVVIEPPSHLPDLHAVMISVYSFFHFVGFFVVFHWLQWTAVDDPHISEVAFADSHKLKTH